MTDLSNVSTEDLMKAANAAPADSSGDISSMPTEQLLAAAMKSPGHQRTIVETGLRQLGLTGRYLLEGLSSLPLMVGDAANAAVDLGTQGINKVAGTNIPKLGPASAQFEKGLDAAGLPSPETPTERIVGEMSKAVASIPTAAAGASASGAKALAPLTENLAQQATAAAGAGAGYGVAEEATDNPIVQTAAGLAGGVAGGLRTGVRPQVAKRLEDFKTAGVDPSLPDVTQSPTIQRAQNINRAVPLAGDVIKTNEMDRLAQAENSAGKIASGYGDAQSPRAVGQSAQDAIENYRFGKSPGVTDREALLAPTRATSVSRKAEAVYNAIPIDGDAQIPVPKTVDALKNATARFDNPDLANEMADPQMKRWSDILTNSNGQLSWDDLRGLRTEVRYMMGKAKLDPSIDDRTLSQLDTALSSDMLDGAKTVGGDRAASLVGRADKYYALSMQRIDSGLKSVYRVDRPEAAYQQIENALSAKPSQGDLDKLKSLRRVMTDSDWGDLSASVIDRLGQPTPGNAPTPGNPSFSVSQFVTRYAGMSDEAKNLLFNTAGRTDLRDRLDALYRAAADMKATDRLANTSNSGNHVINAAVVGGMLTAPVKTIGMLAGANATARAFYNPTFIGLMTQSLKATTPQAKATIAAQVVRFAQKNPDLANESQNLIRSLSQPRAEDSEESK